MTEEHVRANREAWDADAGDWVDRGRRDWAREEIGWGIWHVPESELRLLPPLEGIDVVERIPHATAPNRHNLAYLNTKASRSGHLL